MSRRSIHFHPAPQKASTVKSGRNRNFHKASSPSTTAVRPWCGVNRICAWLVLTSLGIFLFSPTTARAAYSDTDESRGQYFQAGAVNFSVRVVDGVPDENTQAAPGGSNPLLEKQLEITNTGSVTVAIAGAIQPEEPSACAPFIASLETALAPVSLLPDATSVWTLSVTLPPDSPSPTKEPCRFNLALTAWQNTLPDSMQGWTAEENLPGFEITVVNGDQIGTEDIKNNTNDTFTPTHSNQIVSMEQFAPSLPDPGTDTPAPPEDSTAEPPPLLLKRDEESLIAPDVSPDDDNNPDDDGTDEITPDTDTPSPPAPKLIDSARAPGA